MIIAFLIFGAIVGSFAGVATLVGTGSILTALAVYSIVGCAMVLSAICAFVLLRQKLPGQYEPVLFRNEFRLD